MCATENSTKVKRYRADKAFQRLWVAGTLGAFFAGLARTLPVDVRQAFFPFNAEFLLHAALRYGYLIWLIWYFFLSNLRTQADDPPEDHEVAYDVAQSVCGLGAAYYLDFLVANEHHGIRAFMAPNIAIFVICFLALIWFRNDGRELQFARGAGAVIAAAAAIGVWFIPQDRWCVVAVLFVPLALLIWPLWRYQHLKLAETKQGGEVASSGAPGDGREGATKVIAPAPSVPTPPAAEGTAAKAATTEKKSI